MRSFAFTDDELARVRHAIEVQHGASWDRTRTAIIERQDAVFTKESAATIREARASEARLMEAHAAWDDLVKKFQ